MSEGLNNDRRRAAEMLLHLLEAQAPEGKILHGAMHMLVHALAGPIEPPKMTSMGAVRIEALARSIKRDELTRLLNVLAELSKEVRADTIDEGVKRLMQEADDERWDAVTREAYRRAAKLLEDLDVG